MCHHPTQKHNRSHPSCLCHGKLHSSVVVCCAGKINYNSLERFILGESKKKKQALTPKVVLSALQVVRPENLRNNC